jgi:hypothetical protein
LVPYFFDASALVKGYLHEPGSGWVRRVLTRMGTPVFISPLSGAEVLAAIARKARACEIHGRTQREGVTAFRRDYQRRFAHIAVSAGVVEEAMALVLAHPLRGADAVQLGSALLLREAAPRLRALIFVAADSPLLRVARRTGLATENPLDHP